MSAIFFLLLTPVGVFQGKIFDSFSREPVPYAEVRVVPPDVVVWTDSTGRFVVAGVVPEEVSVKAERVGYEPGFWSRLSTSGEARLFLVPRSIPVAGVTITASRLGKRVCPAQPVTVIENRSGALRGTVDVSGVLGGAAGVQVQDYNNLATVSIRGTSAEQTLVMMDGVKLNTALNNQADLTLITTGVVQRVEVVRGGASALYGANPIGGVVNIITPEPERFGMAAQAGLGSFGRRYLRAAVFGPGRLNYFVAGGLIRADNRWTYRDEYDSIHTRVNADISRQELLLKCGAGLGAPGYLSLLGLVVAAQRGSPGPVMFPSDSARLKDSRLLAVIGYDLKETDYARLSARFSHQRLWQNYYNPDEYFPANDTHLVHQTGLSLNQWVEPMPWWRSNIGLELTADRAASTAVGSPERLSRGFFLETGFNWQIVQITPVLRYDLIVNNATPADSQPFRSTYGAFSPRLGVVVNPIPALSCYFGANQSFRSPTFNELWWPRDNWTGGNPRLKPEKGTGIEAGLGMKLGRVGACRFNLHRSDLEDLIQWVADSSFFYQPVNIARATITGLETEAGFDFQFFGLDISANYQVCRSGEKDLPYRPRFLAKAVAWGAYQIPPLSETGAEPAEICRLSLTGSAVSFRYTDSENTDTLPGYLLLDTELALNPLATVQSFRVKPKFIIGCKNILNRQYESIKGYPIAGRNVYLEIDIGL